MLQGHSFKNNSGILNKNFMVRPTKGDTIDFSFALKSIDIPDEKFMNFFTSNQTKIYLKLKNLYELSLKNEFNIDKLFTDKEYSTTNQLKNNRLRKFIYETSHIIMNDIDLLGIIKYKNKEDNEFQLFIKYDLQQRKAFVYLIDIYHLAIPTEFRKINQRSKNTEEYYLKMKSRLKDSACGLETLIPIPTPIANSSETINN